MTLVVRLLKDGDQSLLERVAPGVFDRDVDPSLADAFLRDPRHHVVAAIAHDRIVGFVSALDYWHPDKPRELWINEVGVTSDWRRRGVGTQLMQATLDHGRALGCFEAWVLTDRKNLAALALYRKVGGVESGTDLIMFTFMFRLREAASARRNADGRFGGLQFGAGGRLNDPERRR